MAPLIECAPLIGAIETKNDEALPTSPNKYSMLNHTRSSFFTFSPLSSPRMMNNDQTMVSPVSTSNNTTTAIIVNNEEKKKNDYNEVVATTPILVEIIGATNLSLPKKCSNTNGKLKPMHPFVVAKLHKAGVETQILARTKHRKDTTNPIWCVEHRCLILLQVAQDLMGGTTGGALDVADDDDDDDYVDEKETVSSQSESLYRIEFEVRHKDANNPNSCTSLGSVNIDLKSILDNCTQERMEYKLERKDTTTTPTTTECDNCDADNVEDDEHGKIAIRFKEASELDIQLMNEIERMQEKGICVPFTCDDQNFLNCHDAEGKATSDEHQKVELITEKDQSSVGYTGMVTLLSTAFRNKKTDNDGNVKYLVRPNPDPKRKEMTTYLSHDEMQNEMLKPSSNWVAAGKETSKSLGKVYLEILGCSDLPNMDTGEALGNKTDAFVCAIYEDSMVQTDVIDDKLSPIWFPWTQRAFIFQMTHPFSPLYISVNDYDLGPGGHDGIGRVAINLSNVHADTLYTLHYNLYPASNTTDREVS